MKDLKFKLKKDVVLPVGEFGSGEFMTKANMSNELAYQVLEQHPHLIEHFEEYPRNEDGSYNDVQDVEELEPQEEFVTQYDLDLDTILVEAGVVVGDAFEVSNEKLRAFQEANPPIVNEEENEEPAVAKSRPGISKINRLTLTNQYAEKFGHIPTDDLTKNDLYDALNP